MSGDQRITHDTGEPAKNGEPGARRWADYLQWCRSDIVQGVLALPAGQRRQTLVPSGWTPVELLSHMLHMEQRWFVWGFLGEQVAEPWGDWTVDEPWDESKNGRWHVADDVAAEHLARRLNDVGARTRKILLDHPLDATAASGGRFGDDPPTLEWICFHVLAEYARHAGQLDIVVEQTNQ